jgi:hypothetical protein
MNQWTRFELQVAFAVAATQTSSAVALASAYFNGENFAAWLWDRHQNQFSWYSRPLFLVSVCANKSLKATRQTVVLPVACGLGIGYNDGFQNFDRKLHFLEQCSLLLPPIHLRT